jgi:hypothetical protein
MAAAFQKLSHQHPLHAVAPDLAAPNLAHVCYCAYSGRMRNICWVKINLCKFRARSGRGALLASQNVGHELVRQPLGRLERAHVQDRLAAGRRD